MGQRCSDIVMAFDLNPDFIERYQLLLQKDPRSKLFAPLAEAYRKNGWTDEAYELCKKGTQFHPHFPGGKVVFAKILIERGERDEALEQLKAASDLSPENILAQRLLAQLLLEMRRPKEALRAFKMVLFLNPQDESALKNVKRLESLTADEFDEELFEMKPLAKAVRPLQTTESPQPATFAQTARGLERALSLIDAFVVRSDFDRALKFLDESEDQYGPHPELTKRRVFLTRKNADLDLREESAARISPVDQPLSRPLQSELYRLKAMLQRINDRRVE